MVFLGQKDVENFLAASVFGMKLAFQGDDRVSSDR